MTDTSGIADEDGLSSVAFSCRWLGNEGSSDETIDSETVPSYTLDANDESNAITVMVTFTDDEGKKETQTGAATTPVAPR